MLQYKILHYIIYSIVFYIMLYFPQDLLNNTRIENALLSLKEEFYREEN